MHYDSNTGIYTLNGHTNSTVALFQKSGKQLFLRDKKLRLTSKPIGGTATMEDPSSHYKVFISDVAMSQDNV